MKLVCSPYLVWASAEGGCKILADLASGAMASLSAAESEALREGRDDTGAFQECGFLVSDSEQTVEGVVRRHQIACSRPAVLNLTILPTLACNFACTYCFEKGGAPVRMSNEIADAIVAFTRRNAPGHLLVNVAWFGGEPLLELARIRRLHPRISEAAHDAGCDVTANITTNGYNLTRHAVRTLNQLGIQNIQVTLDGPPDVHDSQRFTRGGRGTFARIFENAMWYLDASPRGTLGLRCNVTSVTVNSIARVLEDVPVQVRNRVTLNIHPITRRVGSDAVRGDDVPLGVDGVYQHARSLGFQISPDDLLDPSQAVHCYAERRTSAVIDPRGWVFKCAYTNYSETERIGTLEADGSLAITGNFLQHWQMLCDTRPRKCMECVYLPICGFGCPRNRIELEYGFDCGAGYSSVPETLRVMATSASVPAFPANCAEGSR